MRNHVRLGWILVGGLAFLLLTSTASGQAVYGSIAGTVTDPQGNAVAGAKVTVTSITKNTSEETSTNESGYYTVFHLIPDTYKVHIESTGFKVFEVASVLVQVDTQSHVEAQLQVGAVTQSVEVTGEVPQLKTDRADVSIDLNSAYVEQLPILNRNYTTLLLDSPGTQKLVGWSHAATENPQGSQQTFVAGQHFSGTGYELDGTDNQDPILGIIVINPNLDSVGETKIMLQNFDAEFGKSIAGLMVASTKSGTNEIHGSAFWFRNSDATQARDPITQTPAKVPNLPSAKWNQYGGSVGGAIIKNKLFYFGDVQLTRQANGVTNNITIPTAKVLSTCTASTGMCDLSDYLGKAGGGGQIYDPATGNQLTGAGRTAFAGNLIPVSRLSPAAVNILKKFPQPINGNIQNNFFGSGSGPFHQNSLDTRGDYQAPGNVHIFGRYSLAYYSLTGTPNLGIGLGGPGSGVLGLSGSSNIHNHSLSTGFDKAISATLLTDFRFGWFKYNPHSIKPDATVAAATALGLPGLNTSDPSTLGLPAFNFDSSGTFQTLTNFGDGLGPSRCNCPLIENEHQYQFVNNWTKISGNHTMKVGADIRFAHNFRFPSDANRTGQLNFSHLITSNTVGSSQVGGLDLASFLLGDVSSFERFDSLSSNATETQRRYFLYGEDTFRMTSKLTFTYGIRWEDYAPEVMAGKDLGGFANLSQGIIRVAGEGPYGLNGNINSDLGAFAPRIGIAYQVRQKTVVRLGYGRSFDMGVFGSNFGHVVTQNLPVLVHQNFNCVNTVGCATANVVPAYQMDSAPTPVVFPTSSIVNGALPIEGPTNNVDPRIRPTTQRVATIDMWNATVQHQLTSTMSVEVAYLGNKGTHGFVGDGPTYNINQPSIVGFGSLSQAQRRLLFNKFVYPNCSVSLTVCSSTFYPSADQLVCCSVDMGNYFGMDATSHYNAVQIKIEKRFSHGLQFVSHYTYARTMHYDGNYYAVNPSIAYGPDDQSRNHAWITNVVYELPFGKGKKYMSNANTLTDYVIGGWRLTNTTNWSGGLPWTPSYSNCSADEDVGVCRPNQASGSFALGVHRDPTTGILSWFTPVATLATNGATGGAFARPAVGALGNVGFDSFRGPHLFTSDLSLAKDFRITERFRAEFRMDANNIFNHPVWGFNANQGNTCIDCGGNAGVIQDLEADTQMRLLTFALRVSF